jgi:alpha-1,6-mannosyltransferase
MNENPSAVTTSTSGHGIKIAFIVIGLVLLALYGLGSRVESASEIVWFLKVVAGQSALYLAAAWLILRTAPTRSTLMIVIAFAILFRLSILFSSPYLSDDVYRYVWDGRVQAAGINPYRYVPADEHLADLRDEMIYPKINRRDYAHTIYPPVAEAIYFLTTRISESVTWMKATMVGFEAIALWAIAQLLAAFGLPRQRILLYAWHPLTVWEFAGNGHLDAIAIAFIALALLARQKNAEVATGVTLACATLVKLFPLVLLPAVYKRGNWKMPLAFTISVIIAYLPYIGVGPLGVLGFLPGYAGERGIVSGEQFFMLGIARRLLKGFYVPNLAFLIFALLLLFVVSVWTVRHQRRRGDGYLTGSMIMASVFAMLLAPHFPWYFSWLIPFLCFLPVAPIFYLTLASFLLYLTWLGDTLDRVFRLNALLYLPCLILGVIAVWLRHRRFRMSLDQSGLVLTSHDHIHP